MAGTKISNLPALTTLADADVLPIVDVSALATKKVTAADFAAYVGPEILPWVEPLAVSTGASGAANRAVLAAAVAASPDVELVRIPGGLYLLDKTPVTVDTDGRFDLRGDGTVVLQRADGTHDADFQYMFALAATSGAKRITIGDLTLDGNRRANVPPAPTDWEHSAIINVGSGTGTSVIEFVDLSNIEFRDPVADCIWVSRYYVDSLTISRVVARDRAGTRSDIEFSAYPKYTMISNVNIGRLEGEALSIPGGVTHDFHVHVVNSTIRDLVDCAGGGSTVVGRVFWHVDNCYIGDLSIVRAGGTFTNCHIHYPDPAYNQRQIQYADNLTLENCDIYLHADSSGVIAPVLVGTEAANRETKLAFKGCRFHVVPAAGYGGTFTGTAIQFDPWNTAGTIPKFEVSDCWFDPRLEESIFADRCGRLVLKNNDYGGTGQAIRIAQSATIVSDYIIDGGTFDRVTGNMFRFSAAVGGSILIRNIAVPEARGVFTVASGTLSTLPVTSDRILYVTATPTGGALKGDRARLISPASGAPYEWVATTAHVTAATWLPTTAESAPAYKTADQSTSDGVNLSNVTGLLIPVVANGIYIIEGTILHVAAAATTGLVVALTGPASPTYVSYGWRGVSGATSTVNQGTVTGYGVEHVSTGSLGSGVAMSHFWAAIENGANAGNVQLQFRSEVDTSSVTIRRGSTLVPTRVS